MLKAALNRAYNAGRVPSDAAWRKARPFKQANAPVVRYLSRDETRRLVHTCEKDFRAAGAGGVVDWLPLFGAC